MWNKKAPAADAHARQTTGATNSDAAKNKSNAHVVTTRALRVETPLHPEENYADAAKPVASAHKQPARKQTEHKSTLLDFPNSSKLARLEYQIHEYLYNYFDFLHIIASGKSILVSIKCDTLRIGNPAGTSICADNIYGVPVTTALQRVDRNRTA